MQEEFFELADIAANARRKAQARRRHYFAHGLEAVQRIDALFAIEREINGLSADERKAARQNQSVPLLASLEAWMRNERAKLSRHNHVAKRWIIS